MSESTVMVGEITGVSGVNGWIKVFSHTEPRLNIVKYDSWLLKRGKDWKTVKVLNGRAQGKTIVAQIDGVTSRDQAKEIIGAEIAINASQLERLSSQDFYWRDLEGLQVVNLTDGVIGVVSHLIETGANDVLVIKLSSEQAKLQKSKEMMIPYLVGSVVKRVDLDEKLIKVDWDGDYL